MANKKKPIRVPGYIELDDIESMDIKALKRALTDVIRIKGPDLAASHRNHNSHLDENSQFLGNLGDTITPTGGIR